MNPKRNNLKTMRNLIFLFIAFCLYSCKGQTTTALKIDASKVKQISIFNKVDCSFNKLVKQEVTITDREKIETIIKSFSYLQPIPDKGSINMKVAHGFFEMSFDEGEKHHYYTINYTVYDGVIVSNDNNGEIFKNDRLEISVYKQFVE